MKTRTISFVLTETDGLVTGKVEVEPEIRWAERCTTTLERTAKAMADAAFERGLRFDVVPKPKSTL